MFASCSFRISIFYNTLAFTVEGFAAYNKVSATAFPVLVLELNIVKRALFLV